MAVYILHLDTPLDQGPDPRTGKPRAAKHYVGFAERLQERLEQHAKGHGARMMQVCWERGIGFQLARVFEQSGRTFERKLKNTNNVARYCPICAGGEAKPYSPRTVEAQ